MTKAELASKVSKELLQYGFKETETKDLLEIVKEIVKEWMPDADEKLVEKIRSRMKKGNYTVTSEEIAAEILEHLDPSAPRPRHFRRFLDTMHSRLSEETWDSLPTDLSENVDHYVYDTPKN